MEKINKRLLPRCAPTSSPDVERLGSLTPLREAIEREIPVPMGQYRQSGTPSAHRRIGELEDSARRDGVARVADRCCATRSRAVRAGDAGRAGHVPPGRRAAGPGPVVARSGRRAGRV